MTQTATINTPPMPGESIAMRPGVFPGLTFHEYASIEATNWHKLEPFRKSAKAGRYAMLREDSASESMEFGEAFHSAILEPERFAREYVVMPKFDGHHASNAYKAAKAAWEAEHQNDVTLTKTESEELAAMRAAVRAHPVASAIMAGRGRNELSVVWEDAEAGLCKGRVDRLTRIKAGVLNPLAGNPHDDVIVLVDFKTTRSCEEYLFNSDASKFGYHAQLAFYHDGLQAHQPAPMKVLIVAVESSPPFDVVVYMVDDDALEQGRRLYRRLIGIMVDGKKRNRWPGISDGIVPLVVKDWAKEPSTQD